MAELPPVTDWVRWHDDYDDPTTSIARRLPVVRACIANILDHHPANAGIRILSLCAGDGRDLLPLLPGRIATSWQVTLVEQDPELAARARTHAATIDADIRVVQADAGVTATYVDELPVDLLLLCGIFGNIPATDIAGTVSHIPGMLRPGGHIIWTRGSSDPDLRGRIRRWIDEAGLTEAAWHAEPHGYGIGVAHLDIPLQPGPPALPGRLFRFQP